MSHQLIIGLQVFLSEYYFSLQYLLVNLSSMRHLQGTPQDSYSVLANSMMVIHSYGSVSCFSRAGQQRAYSTVLKKLVQSIDYTNFDCGDAVQRKGQVGAFRAK
jgi:hypothetical protein